MKHPLLHTAARGRVAMLLTLLLLVVASPTAASAATGSVSGVAFDDLDRDGVHDPGEPGFEGHRIYLFDGQGNYLANALTDANGAYRFSSRPAGEYRIEYASYSWYAVRDAWAPTTGSGLVPRRSVTVDGDRRVDFGWRPITRSTTLAAPISVAQAASGLRIESFNDVVPASEILAALESGLLLGSEAGRTTIRFAYGSSSSCSSGATSKDGRYVDVTSACYVSYVSWLDGGDRTLFHEYGHAWANYFAYVVHQDPTLAGYLRARGIEGDTRLETSHAWTRQELIAEDYRQLFGSDHARLGGQENTSLPRAADVAGLEEYLRGPFRSGPSPEPTPEPTPSPTTEVPDAAPTVAFVTPGDGATVSGTITIAVRAADREDPSEGLAVSVMAGVLSLPTAWDAATGTFTATLDTARLSDGTTALTATARDSAGNVTSAGIQVVVANAPTKGGKGGKGGDSGGGGRGPKNR